MKWRNCFFGDFFLEQQIKSQHTYAVISAVEITIIYFYAFSLVWFIAPAKNIWLVLSTVACAVIFTLVSHRLHGETAASIGLRLDNMRSSIKLHAIFTIICLIIAGVWGFMAGSLRWNSSATLKFFEYFFWAAFQQFFFLSFFTTRLKDLFCSRYQVALVNAILFSSIHAPNLFLIAATFISGYFWTYVFYRYPNLLLTSLSHAILAVALLRGLPEVVNQGMRIGPMYYH